MSALEIMLVEDNPADAFLVRLALKEAGLTFQLNHCSDGEEAMSYLDKAESGVAAYPHLLMLDLNIPKISGHEVLKAVRKSKQLHSIPVIIMSSSESPTDKKLVQSYGANHYFPKPPDLAQFMKLGAVVRELLK